MRTIPRILFGLALTLAPLVSTVASAQDSYDYKRGANFAGIKTFGFKLEPPMDPVASKTTTYDSPLIRERTIAAITMQLEARGMKRVDENPDVYITPRRTFEMEYTYYGPGYGYGWGAYPAGYAVAPYGGSGWVSGWNGWNSGVYAELQGTLTVDVEDAHTGTLLWRGVETKHVHETSKPAHRDKRVAEEVSDVFKHFPTLGTVGVVR